MKEHTWIQWMELVLLAVLAALLAWSTALEKQQQRISGHLIRMHVVANSDDPADQEIKLTVRDAVLARAEEILAGATSQSGAKRLLRDNLALLEQTANDTLRGCGATDQATVTMERELFGTRDYEDFSLPGGYYDALRVSIGAGEGHNWWCVVYPQICTAATAEDRESIAVMGGLDAEELAILEGDTPEYQLKFRALELLENLLGWFRSGTDGVPVSR